MSIFLTPQAYVNDTVQVSGDGLGPNRPLTLQVGGRNITTVSGGGSLNTDAGGTFNFTFVVPAGIGAGPVPVQVNDGTSTLTGTLTILGPLASLSLSPVQGVVGSAVTASGNSFRANSPITLRVGTHGIAGCTAGGLTTDANGAFSCTFPLPSVTSGAYTVTASDGQDSDSAALAVTGTSPGASAPTFALTSTAAGAVGAPPQSAGPSATGRDYRQLNPFERDYAHLPTFENRAALSYSKPAWFIVQGGGPTIHLWINPQTYNEQSQSLYAEVPALTAMIRLNFGEQPVNITLEGTTGIAGYDAGDHGGMVDLERLKPQSGYPDVQVEFHYPYMFSGGRFCYINQFVQETRPSAPLFYFYTIQLICYDIVAKERRSYEPIDPRLPSGRPVDCLYSSLNLPWTNPQHPPGFLFLPGGAAEEEQKQALYPRGPCTAPPRPGTPPPLPSGLGTVA